MYSEKINILMNRCKNNPNDLASIVNYINLVVKYANFIIAQPLTLQMQSFRLSDENFEDFKFKLELERVAKHDKACEALAALNSLAMRHGMLKIFNFELERDTCHPPRMYSADTHYIVSGFTGDLMNELYKSGLEIFQDKSRKLDIIADWPQQNNITTPQDLKNRIEACIDAYTLDFLFF